MNHQNKGPQDGDEDGQVQNLTSNHARMLYLVHDVLLHDDPNEVVHDLECPYNRL